MFECVSPPDAVMWPAARSITCSDSTNSAADQHAELGWTVDTSA